MEPLVTAIDPRGGAASIRGTANTGAYDHSSSPQRYAECTADNLKAKRDGRPNGKIFVAQGGQT
jgi:hypothetical protein